MSRIIAPAVRRQLETADAPEDLLAFMTIRHYSLPVPIRVVSDVMDHRLGGLIYAGVPFGFRQLTDGETGPRSQIVVQAVDRRLTRALLATEARATVSLQLHSTADFDLSQDPREEIGTSTPVYGWQNFDLVNVEGTAAEMSGDIELTDFTVEPWPSLRATQNLLPGLFR